MTDVRRIGSPKRLREGTVGTRLGMPIVGEVDGIWQRAFHAQIKKQIKLQPELPGAESFGKSLTINTHEIKFFLLGSATLLPHYLDMIESAIPLANHTAAAERERLAASVAESARELRERDDDVEQALKSWDQQQAVNS